MVVVDFRRLYVHVLGARDLQLGGGGTLTVLVTTGDGKHCRAESEAAQAVAAPRWQFETSLGLPAVGKPPHHSDSEAMVQFSVHRRHFLATEVVGSAAVQLATLKGAGARQSPRQSPTTPSREADTRLALRRSTHASALVALVSSSGCGRGPFCHQASHAGRAFALSRLQRPALGCHRR